MSWLDEILPPDRADRIPIYDAAKALVAELAKRAPGGRVAVTIRLDEAGWKGLENATRRPYRASPSLKQVHCEEGTVEFVKPGGKYDFVRPASARPSLRERLSLWWGRVRTVGAKPGQASSRPAFQDGPGAPPPQPADTFRYVMVDVPRGVEAAGGNGGVADYAGPWRENR